MKLRRLKTLGAKQTKAVKTLKAEAQDCLDRNADPKDKLAICGLFLILRIRGCWDWRKVSNFVKRLDDEPHHSYAPLRNLVRPYFCAA